MTTQLSSLSNQNRESDQNRVSHQNHDSLQNSDVHFKKIDQLTAFSQISNQDRQMKQNLSESRIRRLQGYQNQIETKKMNDAIKAEKDWEDRGIVKERQRIRYEKAFDGDGKYGGVGRRTGMGKRVYDNNMSIEEMKQVTKGTR